MALLREWYKFWQKNAVNVFAWAEKRWRLFLKVFVDYTDKRRNEEQFLMRKNHAYIELLVFYCDLSQIDRL